MPIFTRARVGLLGLLITATSIAAVAVPAGANEPPRVTDEELVQILDAFRANGTPEEKIPGLTSKLLAGELTDAETPGETPVSTSDQVIRGVKVTIERFADGSLTRAEIPDVASLGQPGRTTRALPDCTTVYSSAYQTRYSGCTAYKSWFTRALSYKVNVTQNKGGAGTITAYYGPMCTGVGGVTSQVLERINSAKVRLTCHFKIDVGTGATSAYWLQTNQGTGTSLTLTSGMQG